jgi:hypothetical protein
VITDDAITITMRMPSGIKTLMVEAITSGHGAPEMLNAISDQDVQQYVCGLLAAALTFHSPQLSDEFVRVNER